MKNRMNIAVIVLLLFVSIIGPVYAHPEDDHHNEKTSNIIGPFSLADSWVKIIILSLILVIILFLKEDFVLNNFEYLFIFGLLWGTVGVVMDAKSHAGGAPEVFINLEHSIAYSGALILLAIFFIVIYNSWKKKDELLEKIPKGYKLALLSPLIFILGGVGDMLWHSVFGFEVLVHQMLSPTHLLLGVAAIFMVTGPLRNAWFEGIDKTWKKQLPMLISAFLLLSLLTFMMQHFHPFTEPFAVGETSNISTNTSASSIPINVSTVEEMEALIAVSGFVMVTIFMMFIILHLKEKFNIVPGGLTLVLTLNAFLMTFLSGHFEFMLVGLITGIAADFLHSKINRKKKDIIYRVYSGIIPFIFASVYFFIIHLTRGIGWTIHVWSGIIVMLSAVGVLVSYAIQPSLKGH